ncbi:hypothetical protein [Endozoicomonas numazuensis]|uniref:Uncharacterized protein n=1 Tax=Endozoicomonas numazuensis TaxID=1137799 RepID=A0A081NDQ4_9GAMM|nr:hypothetical protein [Endozoicomonas numazuensis]KEQ16577.1 hypothetical protein GZ78_22360 [Endozoicomonas numazuensis]
MDFRRFFGSKIQSQAKNHSRLANLLFEGSPQRARVFSHIVNADYVFYQTLFNEDPDQLLSWFVKPNHLQDAIQALGLIANFYKPQTAFFRVEDRVLNLIRSYLSGIDGSYNIDIDSASKAVALHLLKINKGLVLFDNEESLIKELESMLANQQLEWLALIG